MEEKSIDELRREAQELYQAKLLAYQQSQKQDSKQVTKEVATPREPVKLTKSAKSTKSEFLKIKLPFNQPETTESVQMPLDRTARPKHNWFVVIVFTLLTIVVLVKVMVIKP